MEPIEEQAGRVESPEPTVSEPVPPARSDIAAMRAVTISRLYGSGGGEIGTQLAHRLGWQLVDHEIVVQVAEQMGMTVQEADARDERADGFFARMLATMQVTSGGLSHPEPLALPLRELQAAYHRALSTTVEAAANQGHVVIIGRGSQMLLASRRDVLHVRVVAPLDRRIAYVARREGISSEEAGLRIRLKDRDRRNYLRTQYHQLTDDPLLYDLTINTAMLNLDSSVDLILLALEAKSTTLNLPEEDLGPAAGQSRYPGKPLDLQTPFAESSPP
jgi:CMP/dCMP kinase